MKKHVLSLLVFGISILSVFAQTTQQQRLEQHVYTLAADSLNGRQAGSDDAARARAYIARQWQEMGLKPLWGDTYEMPFEVFGEKGYCNLVAFIEGNDPVLKEEYIVVGGHYDHLGVRNGQVYNGADDNASGTACVTEMARQLLARQNELKRSVVICAFDAEEMGLHGSDALAKRMEGAGIIDKVKLMMSIDMVGWLKQGGALTLEGTGTLENPHPLMDARELGIDINIHHKKYENSIFTATDTEPFAKKGIATLAVTTGLKSPYHKPGDDADLIDYEGLDLVTNYMAAFTLRASQHPGMLASGKVAPKHRQKLKKFNVGLAIGYNRDNVILPDAAVMPKSLLGGNGGLALQYNFNNSWALHSEILYTYTRTQMPLADDAFGPGYRIQQHGVTVPLMLQAGYNAPSAAVYLRLGGYFNYLIAGNSYTKDNTSPTLPDFKVPTPYRGGIVWGWGIRLASITFDFHYYYQLGPLFDTSAGLPDAEGNNYAFSLGYWF